ncbi:hypothetical protein V8F20_008550 [Naviculisporaceae sp. PSN 640]
MRLSTGLLYAVFMVFHALLVAAADLAYIQASIANMTADISSIKVTAGSINTNTDYIAYPLGMGKYKVCEMRCFYVQYPDHIHVLTRLVPLPIQEMENKLNALTTRTGTWNTQIQGSTVSTTAEIETIVTAFQTLAIELIATIAGITDKAGLVVRDHARRGR